MINLSGKHCLIFVLFFSIIIVLINLLSVNIWQYSYFFTFFFNSYLSRDIRTCCIIQLYQKFEYLARPYAHLNLPCISIITHSTIFYKHPGRQDYILILLNHCSLLNKVVMVYEIFICIYNLFHKGLNPKEARIYAYILC